MGVKDSKAKEYISDNERFSDLCNYVLFDGAKIIDPNELVEKDTTEVLSIFGIDQKQIILQKWRDILKNVTIKYTGGMYVVLIGIENQTDVHYAMPVKSMIYDALSYGQQINEAKKIHAREKDYESSAEFLSGFSKKDKLTPVITITVYLGIDKWDGPKSLYEMLGDVDEKILPFVSDYKINLVEPGEITDFTKFKTGLRQLFEILKNGSDMKKIDAVLKSDTAFTAIDAETAAVINMFSGLDLKVEEKDEVVDMCKAWEDQKECGRIEGRIEGRTAGRIEGRMEGRIEERIEIISRFLQNGGTKEDAKRMLAVSDEDIIMAEKQLVLLKETAASTSYN